MADTPTNDPRAAQRAPAAGQPTAAPGDPRARTAAGSGQTAPAGQQSQPQGLDAVNAALDDFQATHMQNSVLSRRTDLYNEAHSHIRALKELFSQAHGPATGAAQPQRTAENQDAFQAGSNNANV